MRNKNIIILSGPTATGKTALSLHVANEIKQRFEKSVAILNFDSLLFYQELNIGTAKPSLKERQDHPHFMIDCESARSPINAALYLEKASPLLEDLLAKQFIVLLVGGSGFYLRALLEGMYPSQTTPPEILEKSKSLYHSEGILPFWNLLKTADPESFETLHLNDHYRIIRAVEHFWTTQTKFSDVKKIHEQQKELKRKTQKDWHILHCYLDIPKPIHQEIIQKRTLEMIQKGLVEEVKALLDQGFTGTERPLQSIGYKEILAYLKEPKKDIAQCIERIEISTRQLAKAQRTWFNRVQSKTCYNPLLDKKRIINDICSSLSQE